jgi:hypothetical protein
MKNQIGPWTPILMKAVLLTKADQREKALLKIYARQTTDEQQIEGTIYHNNIGFNGSDGNILSSFAKQLLSKNFLSINQHYILTKKIVKYSRQLCEEANYNWATKIGVRYTSDESREQAILETRKTYLEKYSTVINELMAKKLKK